MGSAVEGCATPEPNKTYEGIIPQEGLPNHAKAPDEPSDPARIALAHAYLADMELVANKTSDPEAIQITKYLQANASVMAPHASGGRYLRVAADPNQQFAFVPLMEIDAHLAEESPYWAHRFQLSAIANYDIEHNMIVCSPAQMTPIWSGIALLHEGNHLVTWRREQYDYKDSYTFCIHEVRTHEFQNRLMAKLGSAAYQQFIDAEVNKLLVLSDKLPPNQSVTISPSESFALAKIFGPYQSELEKDWRATSIATAINFAVVDRRRTIPAAKKEEAKAVHLHKMYLKQGILTD